MRLGIQRLEQFEDALAHPAVFRVGGLAPVPVEVEGDERQFEGQGIDAQAKPACDRQCKPVWNEADQLGLCHHAGDAEKARHRQSDMTFASDLGQCSVFAPSQVALGREQHMPHFTEEFHGDRLAVPDPGLRQASVVPAGDDDRRCVERRDPSGVEPELLSWKNISMLRHVVHKSMLKLSVMVCREMPIT